MHYGSTRILAEPWSLIVAAGPLAEARLIGTDTFDWFIVANQGGWHDDLERFLEYEDMRGHTGEAVSDSWSAHGLVVAKLWPAIEAVARALLGSTRALTYREVRAIAALC
jgi:hypothetical protein